MYDKNERQIILKWRSVRVHVQILAVKVQSSKNERRSRTPVTFSVHRTSLVSGIKICFSAMQALEEEKLSKNARLMLLRTHVS